MTSQDHAPHAGSVTSGQSHTAGPWRVAPDFGESHGQFSILDRDGAEVASAEAWIGEHRPEAEANARLIAAAPDLLDALKEAVALSDGLAARHGWERLPEAEATLVRMRAAISKATNRP